MRRAAGSSADRQTCVQVTVPDGWHAGVELAGVAEELVGPLLVACGVRGPGVQDQPPGGDLLLVLPPQPGTRGVQGGGLVDQLPGLIHVSGPVGLVGGHGGAVGVPATAAARTCSWADGVLALRGGVPTVTAGRHARFRCGWMASGFVRAAAAAGFLLGCSGTAWILLGHPV